MPESVLITNKVLLFLWCSAILYLFPLIGKQGWLETHLWHSKRFHMSSSTAHFVDWGCRVALRSYDKTFRASYRAVAKHCAIQVRQNRFCFL